MGTEKREKAGSSEGEKMKGRKKLEEIVLAYPTDELFAFIQLFVCNEEHMC